MSVHRTDDIPVLIIHCPVNCVLLTKRRAVNPLPGRLAEEFQTHPPIGLYGNLIGGFLIPEGVTVQQMIHRHIQKINPAGLPDQSPQMAAVQSRRHLDQVGLILADHNLEVDRPVLQAKRLYRVLDQLKDTRVGIGPFVYGGKMVLMNQASLESGPDLSVRPRYVRGCRAFPALQT